jgi:hypothetical protein
MLLILLIMATSFENALGADETALAKKTQNPQGDPINLPFQNNTNYADFNQWLYQNPTDPHQAIGVFGRLGVSNGEVSIIKTYTKEKKENEKIYFGRCCNCDV